MSDRPPPKKRPGPPTRQAGTGGLGQDQQADKLKGIAPAVVDAFLSANKKLQGDEEGPEETRGLFSPPPPPPMPQFDLPRRPASLGAFAADLESPPVRSKFERLRELAQAAREAPPLAEPEAAADEPPADPMLERMLARRGKPIPADLKARGTAPLPRNTDELRQPGTGDLRLQNLAARAKAKAAKEAGPNKLERTVEAALGAQGTLRLKQSLKALEDRALPGKLGALADSVNKLLPEGTEHYAKLGLEVGKQVLQNNLNPVLAIGMAAKEVKERLHELERWDELSNKERVANMALLTSNMAEILGAVTPPPVNAGIQLLGAGMLLMGMAAEHSEVVEDLAKVTVGEKAKQVVTTGVDGASGHIAGRVKNAWDELNDRLAIKKPRRPRLPAQLQAMVDSQAWKQVKQHPAGARVAEGTENVLYNLARRGEALQALWGSRIEKARETPGKLKGMKRPRRPREDRD